MSKCPEHLIEYQKELAERARNRPAKPPKPIKSRQGEGEEAKGSSKPRKPLPRRKANGDLGFFRELFTQWEAEGRNYCLECARWLSGEVSNMAHVVGDGECGGNREVGLDPENIVPMCPDHHTQMDQGLNGKFRADMKCWPELERIRRVIVSRYGLKVRNA